MTRRFPFADHRTLAQALPRIGPHDLRSVTPSSPGAIPPAPVSAAPHRLSCSADDGLPSAAIDGAPARIGASSSFVKPLKVGALPEVKRDRLGGV